MISKECRCKALDFDVKCIETDVPVMCDSKCNKKMTCRVHKCQIICCPAKRSEDLDNLHACVQLCGKTGMCSVHPCSRFCHTGACPPCDIMMNTSLSCACGAKRVNPPVKCGTEVPICNNTCGKILECGHPCYDKCHFGDCRPCQEIIEKLCACGKVTMKNVTCSQNQFCMNICETKYEMCNHKCNQLCHIKSCESIMRKRVKDLIECSKFKNDEENLGCGNLCEKTREICGHPCQYYCHPTIECPITPCPYVSRITCKCKNRQAFVDCGATDKIIQKELPCDSQCKNLQRFKALYEKGSKKSYYAGTLVKYARNNLMYVQKLEKQLEDFIIRNCNTLDFKFEKKQMDKVRFLQILLPKHYGLEVAYCKFGNYVIVTVKNTPDSVPPYIKLTEYLKQFENKQVSPEILPFDAIIKFHNLSSFDGLSDLDAIVKEYKDHCYSEKDSYNCYLYVWEKDYLGLITKKLKKSCTNFSNFIVDENSKLSEEENKLIGNEHDVVLTDLEKNTAKEEFL